MSRSGFLAFCVFGLALAGGVQAYAQTQTELLNPFDNFSIRDAPDPPPPGGPKVYSVTGPGGHWAISQWNIPGPRLTPFSATQSGGKQIFAATAPESSTTVTRAADDVLVQLSQDGAVLPCWEAPGRARESDLLISTPVKTAALKKIPLSQFSELWLHVKVSVRSGDASIDKACKTNKGGATFAVIMSDTKVHPGQTLFYQLWVSTVCRHEDGEDPCRPGVDAIANFANKNPWGVNDYLPLFGGPWVGPGALTPLSFDLLPRLEKAIAIGPAGMDKDLSHWTLTSVYAGQAIWGDVTMTSQWQDIQLIATQQE